MVKLICVYVPVDGGDLQGATTILMQPWVLNYRKHPFAHEPWRYVDIDLARAPPQDRIAAMAAIDPPTGAPRPPRSARLVVVALVARARVAARALDLGVRGARAVATSRAGDAGVDMAAIARLFGAAPPSSATVASTSGLRLKGVVAPDGGPIASAIFSTGSGRDIAVFVDREIAPGVKLARGESRPRDRLAHGVRGAHRPRGRAKVAPAAAGRGRQRDSA